MSQNHRHHTAPPPTAAMKDYYSKNEQDQQDQQHANNLTSYSEEKSDTAFCLSTPLDLCIPFNTCFIVPERSSFVELFFGKYHGTINRPGLYCRTSCFLELRPVNTDLITYDLENTKVLDANGSPIIVSGIITYEIVNARRATIDVNDAHKFVRDQAPAVLKRVVSAFPYESSESDHIQPCLRRDTGVVSDRMKEALQKMVQVAGVRVESFNINELSYAPEIAHAMLKRQQADALISARKAVVEGASVIAMDAVRNLSEHLTDAQKSSLLSSLLIVLVGEKEATPTLPVQ